MSYAYLMFRRPAWKPKWLARIGVLLQGDYLPMGTVEEVRGKLGELFPKLRWEEKDIQNFAPYLISLKSIKGPVWFASDELEVQISADESGQVTNFQVSRAEPAQIRRLQRKLGLVAFNLQRDSILGIIFG